MHHPNPSAHACIAAAAGTYIHTPRPARTGNGNHAWQRRFITNDSSYNSKCGHDAGELHYCATTVWRDAAQDVAELELTLGLYTNAQMTVRLTPAELRDLAARLIDAANDIETLPAAVLTTAQQGGQR